MADSENSATTWDQMKRLIAWMFRGRCAACGCSREPLEVHHNTYRGPRGEEEPGDIIPLCWGCHAVFEWLRDGSSAMFKGRIRKALNKARRFRTVEGRLRASLEQVREWMAESGQPCYDAIDEIEQGFGYLQAKLAEVEQGLAPFQAMQDCWEVERPTLMTGLDLLRQKDDEAIRRQGRRAA